jgi:hypothetical protein
MVSVPLRVAVPSEVASRQGCERHVTVLAAAHEFPSARRIAIASDEVFARDGCGLTRWPALFSMVGAPPSSRLRPPPWPPTPP